MVPFRDDFDPEQWLAENAIECDRFNARLTPGACRQYQSRDALRCKGCELFGLDHHSILQWGSKERAQRAQRLAVPGRPRDKGAEMSKHKKGKCAECGREEMTLIGRGLCGGCYNRRHKAGTLDAFKPLGPAPVCAGRIVEEVLNEAVAVAVEVSEPVAEPVPATTADFAAQLDVVLAEVRAFLIEKNRAYGNSALEPVRVFSKADPLEQIRVRMDDKLSRLMRGEDSGEDTRKDLLGYLLLEQVVLRAGR